MGPTLEHAFAADAKAAKKFHEVGIAVRNSQPSEDTHAPVHTLFGLVKILVKVIINVPGTLLRSKRLVLDDVPVQPLINRSELLVGKGRAEKLVPGKTEKVRSDPPFAGNHDGVAVQIFKA